MRLTMGHLGDWIVDPENWLNDSASAPLTSSICSGGQVEARIKAGEGEAVGLTRVTVRLNEKGWRGLFDSHGRLISEERW